jgi:glycosyltransferase involved in cell wall biosynthesis
MSEDKIQVYPRGVDINRFHPCRRNGIWTGEYKLGRDSLKLLYVGRISREKNLDLLVEAFRQLTAKGSHAELILVGDGPYKKTLEKDLAGTRAAFTGELKGERLAQAYASSDIFVFPSVTDTFGNVVLEAQASGLPVIVTDQGGPQENLIPEETGVIIPGSDAGALVRAIERLAKTPVRRRQMGKAARQYMESRSFESNFLKTWDLLKTASRSQAADKPPLEKIFPMAS